MRWLFQSWSPVVPIGFLLKGISRLQQARRFEWFTLQLQANWQTSRGEAAGDAHAGDAGQVGGDRVEVFQVHGQRIVGLLAELERGGWRRGAEDEIDVLEGSVVIAANQAADFQC